MIAQLGRGLAAALRQKGGSVLIRLAPDALGQLRVHLTLDKSQVWARLEVSTAEARDLLTRSEGVLRSALESRGLEVKGIEVVSVGDERRGADNQQQSVQGEPARLDGDAGQTHAGGQEQQSRRGLGREREGGVSEVDAALATGAPDAGRWAEWTDEGVVLRIDMTA